MVPHNKFCSPTMDLIQPMKLNSRRFFGRWRMFKIYKTLVFPKVGKAWLYRYWCTHITFFSKAIEYPRISWGCPTIPAT